MDEGHECLATATNRETVREALTAARQYFIDRDRMNAAVHLAPVRYSPLTELVEQALEATDAPQESARG